MLIAVITAWSIIGFFWFHKSTKIRLEMFQIFENRPQQPEIANWKLFKEKQQNFDWHSVRNLDRNCCAYCHSLFSTFQSLQIYSNALQFNPSRRWQPRIRQQTFQDAQTLSLGTSCKSNISVYCWTLQAAWIISHFGEYLLISVNASVLRLLRTECVLIHFLICSPSLRGYILALLFS